jgi:phenylpyruvate tautomerase PptA (4-oxalocrotonate tautomerase family)
MPIIVCTTRAGMNVETKRSIAKQITAAVNETIKSDPSIISVVFNDIVSESSFVDGEFGSDTLIMCNIRGGRSDEAKATLVKRVSDIWTTTTGQDANHVEVGLLEYDPKFIFRGGKRLPDPPMA